MTGETGSSPALIERTHAEPLIEGHPEFGADIDPERKHLEDGSAPRMILEAENPGKGLRGLVYFIFPGNSRLLFFLLGGRPSIGSLGGNARNLPVPAHGAQVQDGPNSVRFAGRARRSW